MVGKQACPPYALTYGANPNIKDDDNISLLDWWTDEGEGILMKEAVHKHLKSMSR